MATSEVFLDGAEGFRDEVGLIAGVGDGEVGREECAEFLDASLDAIDDLEGVGAGLFADLEDDGGNAIEACEGARLFDSVDDIGYVGDADGHTVLGGDDDAVEIFGLLNAAESADGDFTRALIEAVLEANERTKERMIEKLHATFGSFEGKTLAVLGLSFKPDTDDVRESPALPVVHALLQGGAHVRAYDPAAMDACRDELPGVEFCRDAYAAAEGAEAVIILTEWNQFRALELDKLARKLTAKRIVDLRNLYEPGRMAKAGFHYVSVGRPDGVPA